MWADCILALELAREWVASKYNEASGIVLKLEADVDDVEDYCDFTLEENYRCILEAHILLTRYAGKIDQSSVTAVAIKFVERFRNRRITAYTTQTAPPRDSRCYPVDIIGAPRVHVVRDPELIKIADVVNF